MSQPGSQPGAPESTGRAGGYRRTTSGLVGAMVVTVVAVLAVVGLRSLLLTTDRPDGVRSVDWEAQVRAGRADAKLTVAAPRALPEGWRATTAIYTTGSDPRWQLGLLTERERFVGIFERLGSTEDLVEEHVDEDAVEGGTVEVAGQVWQEWTDSGGDYGLSREVEQPVGETGTLLVVGSAEEDVVREVAASLTP